MCDFIYCKSVDESNLSFLKLKCHEYFKQNVNEKYSGFGVVKFYNSYSLIHTQLHNKHFIYNENTSKEYLLQQLNHVLNDGLMYTHSVLFHFRKPSIKINKLTSDSISTLNINRMYIQPFKKMIRDKVYYFCHKGESSEFYDHVEFDSGSDSFLFFDKWPNVHIPKEEDGAFLIVEKSIDKLKTLTYNDHLMTIKNDFIYT